MKKRPIAALVAAPATPASAAVASPVILSDDNMFIGRLLDMSEAEREATLMTLTLGEVTIIGARAEGLSRSCYAVIARKMTQKHGVGWESRKYGGRVLTDLEKAARDALKADLEAIKGTLKANGYSNPDQAIKYIKGHADGSIGAKREPNQNKPRSTAEWLKAEGPRWYKRLNKAEDVNDDDMELYDAIGKRLKKLGMNLRAVLGE